MKALLCALPAVLITSVLVWSVPSRAEDAVVAPAAIEASPTPLPVAAPTVAPTVAPMPEPTAAEVVPVKATPVPTPSPTPEVAPARDAAPATVPAPSPTPTPPPAPLPLPKAGAVSARGKRVRQERAWRGGVGVFYSGVNQLVFPSAEFNDLKYVAKFDLDRAWGFQAEISYSKEHSWGLQAGIMIDNQRSIRSVDKAGGVTGMTYFTGSTLDLRSFYLNALYRWGSFYIPFGASYTGGDVGQPPVLLSSLSSGLGAQAGVGWEFNRHIVVEALYRMMTLKGLETDSGMSTNQGNMGYLWGPQAGVKLLF